MKKFKNVYTDFGGIEYNSLMLTIARDINLKISRQNTLLVTDYKNVILNIFDADMGGHTVFHYIYT